LLDTKGPEIRSGFFEEGLKKLELVKGETIILTTDYTFLGNKHKLACSYPALAKSVQIGQSILCADGSLVLTVLSTDIPAGEITCRIENNASIGERKNMNLPGVLVELPTFTEKDIEGNMLMCVFCYLLLLLYSNGNDFDSLQFRSMP
jgi:pyruvate kinase